MFFTLTAALARILSNSFANVFQKKLSEKNANPLWINFLTYFFLSFLCIFISIKYSWVSFDDFNFWFFAIAGGLMGALGNGFLVKALKDGELSILGPINSYKSIVSLVTAVFILQEFPNAFGILGIAFIIYGSYFIFENTDEKFSFKLLKRKDIQYRIYAMIFTAIEAVFIKKVILLSSPLISFILWCWFGAFFSFLLLLISKINISRELKKTNSNMIVKYFYLVFCIMIMQLSTNYVFKHMNVSYGLAIFQLSSIVSIILGCKIFEEKNMVKKIIGSLIMITGSVIIIFIG